METEGSKEGKTSENESPPLRIDPKCFQDALRAFFQPIKSDDPRLDFYTIYKREATDYDVDYVKKYDEDLNTTLIFAGLFSAVSSAFVIDIYSKLQPDPNDQTVALLRAILLTLNSSAIPNEVPTVPTAPENPPGEIVTATALLFASLLISLLAAFIAMLGKQWLNRYLRHAGGSTIERCGDRQLKCDGLRKWPFHIFIESLPVMLQAALLLLACGLCRYMASINIPIAAVLIGLTSLGVLFYVGIIVTGAYSYACPFQTPASAPLRSLWAKVGPRLILAALPITSTLRILGKVARTRVFAKYLSLTNLCHRVKDLRERIQAGISRVWLHLPWSRSNILPSFHQSSLPGTQGGPPPHTQEVAQWLSPKDMATVQTTSINDARCVSWILRNITDPEAIDAAIRLAGTIRWFDDGVDSDPQYDTIVSTFHTCFDSNREVYPGSRDRAYYSGRAMLWINTLAVCKSEEFARMFPLPEKRYEAPASDVDLRDLLAVNVVSSIEHRIQCLLEAVNGSTASHLRWVSNILLHLSWATHATLDASVFEGDVSFRKEISPPLDAELNCLLMCCNFLGFRVEEGALKVQDKSDRLEIILDQVSRGIVSDLITTSHDGLMKFGVLRNLENLKNRPWCLTEMAYEWCALAWENRQTCYDWESFLLLSLKLGFRHLPPATRKSRIGTLTHTRRHQELIETVFRTNDGEAIADLLRALTTTDHLRRPPYELLDSCTRYIIDLHNQVTVPFSPRLQQNLTRFIEFLGYRSLKELDAERFVQLLNHLHVGRKELAHWPDWGLMLLRVMESSEGVEHLAIQSWELLTEFTIYAWPSEDVTRSSHVIDSILTFRQWDKLECWMCIVWTRLPDPPDDLREPLERAMVSLFRQRPGAVQKLTQWMKKYWIDENGKDVPEAFQKTCKHAHEVSLSNFLPDKGDEEPRLSPSAQPLPSGGNRFWELLPLI